MLLAYLLTYIPRILPFTLRFYLIYRLTYTVFPVFLTAAILNVGLPLTSHIVGSDIVQFINLENMDKAVGMSIPSHVQADI